MSRSRGLKHLEECVNPEYLYVWGGPSVKQAISSALDDIQERAERRFWKRGTFNILLPELHAKPGIVEFVYIQMSTRFPNPSCIGIRMQDEKQFSEDMRVQFVPFGLQKIKNAIPISWHDDLPDWTWKDVVEHPNYYATSSNQIWPPREYAFKAQRYK